MENVYNMIACMEDYVELKMDGVLIWRSFSSCALDSKVGIENWY
jgi:hypothetical protein